MNKTALDQYEEIVTDALKSYSAKLRKSFKTAFIQLMILYMVLPRKINFTQMGRYSDSSEQRFRQLFERGFDWMQFNLFLMRQRFGESARKAIAIDASYISKSGKKTPLYRQVLVGMRFCNETRIGDSRHWHYRH